MHMNQTWKEIFEIESKKDYYKNLMRFLDKEYATNIVYPDKNSVFECFRITPLNKVKVLILGQDPYHGAGQAHGLCFSIANNSNLPPSLKNIYKELSSDINFTLTKNGNLTKWAEQGVLLLNTILTVRANQPKSHEKIGWEIFTDKIISILNELDRPIVFIFWGNNAKSKQQLVSNPKHLILQACHPSPFSATNFFGCKHFSKTNEFLIKNGLEPINWQL